MKPATRAIAPYAATLSGANIAVQFQTWIAWASRQQMDPFNQNYTVYCEFLHIGTVIA
jgi:hypothetical protein